MGFLLKTCLNEPNGRKHCACVTVRGKTLLVRSRVHSSLGAEGLFSSANILRIADVGPSECLLSLLFLLIF